MTAHDFTDPLSYLNAIEAAWAAADERVERCRYCRVTCRMLPMTGAAWGLEIFHEPLCPEQDN